MGIENVVVSPRKIPVEVGNLVKTDKRDAKKLAFALSRGLLKGIHIPTKKERARRQLIRSRESLKRKRTRAIQQIKMLLLQNGILLSQGLTRKTRAMLKELELPPAIRVTLDMLIEEVDLYRKQIRALEKAVVQACQEPELAETYEILQSAPGIGPIIAAALCFEIGQFSLFSSGKKLSAYLGLTPREYSSGEHIYRGRITGQGNPWLRSYLIEACWRSVAKDAELRLAYERIKRNSGSSKKAIVAIASKIVHRLHAMVTKGERYSKAA
jgi:transposase